MIRPSFSLAYGWTQSGSNTDTGQKRLRGRWEVCGGGALTIGKIGAVRLKVPFVYDRSDEASGHADVGGFGDIEVATGTAFSLSNTWRTGGGIELHADTASNPALSANVWRLHPSWSVAHDFTNWLSLTFTAEYNHSIAEEHNVLPQRYLELSLPASFILPYDWSIATNYKAKVNFENGERWTHTVDVGLAKRLPNVPLVLSATFEKPLKGGNERFQVNFTMTYYFERYHEPVRRTGKALPSSSSTN